MKISPGNLPSSGTFLKTISKAPATTIIMPMIKSTLPIDSYMATTLAFSCYNTLNIMIRMRKINIFDAGSSGSLDQ
jgi:hypothetical protein